MDVRGFDRMVWSYFDNQHGQITSCGVVSGEPWECGDGSDSEGYF